VTLCITGCPFLTPPPLPYLHSLLDQQRVMLGKEVVQRSLSSCSC